ncbi:MAG TPA: diguanylate cyclase [Thermoanaerobaculia bacterium]|nr:diguanylate cyclase [Thermoanaerobaculia bacterium]
MSREAPAVAAERQAKQLAVLNEIARLATLALDLRPLLQRIVEALAHKFEWEFVACVTIDRERDRFVCEALVSDGPTDVHVGYTRAIGTGVVGEVAATGLPILLDDVRSYPTYVETAPGVVAELCVPVRAGGAVVAVLNVESTRPAAFHGQLALLETVADQVSSALTTARLFQDAQRRVRLLEMVSEVSKAALEAGELEALLDGIVRYVHERFGVDIAAIILVGRDGEEYELAAIASRTPLGLERGLRRPLASGIVGRAIRTGDEQLVLDVRRDPDYITVDPETVAEYVVPIRLRGRLLGVIDLESSSPDRFSAEDRLVFRTFADQLAGAIHIAAINRELEEANRRLQEANVGLQLLSALDGLTGVANRRRFEEVFNLEWRRASRAGLPLAVAMIDIDHFKRYNDMQGHQRGDDTLVRVAHALAGSLHRAADLVARYGGEEFVVVLPGSREEHAAAYAERLRQEIEALAIPHPGASPEAVVTVSVGVAACVPEPDCLPASLLEAADRALYAAKRGGRNRVERASAP